VRKAQANFLFNGTGNDRVDDRAQGSAIIAGHPEGEFQQGRWEKYSRVVDGEQRFDARGGVGGGGVDGDDIAMIRPVVFAEGNADTLADGKGGGDGVGDGIVEDRVEGALDGDVG